jgi:hypothetical protein
MYLKIMGREDAPDSDSRRLFTLFDHVASADFERERGKAVVHVVFEDDSQETFDVPGNAYLMNQAGNTVASFGAASIPRTAPAVP